MFGFSSFSQVLIVIFIAYVGQIVLTTFQVSNYRKTLAELKPLGKIGTSKRKGIFNGEVIILVADGNGRVVGAKIMKGATIFARFKDCQEVVGKHIDELERECEHNKKKKYMVTAINQLRPQLEGCTS